MKEYRCKCNKLLFTYNPVIIEEGVLSQDTDKVLEIWCPKCERKHAIKQVFRRADWRWLAGQCVS